MLTSSWCCDVIAKNGSLVVEHPFSASLSFMQTRLHVFVVWFMAQIRPLMAGLSLMSELLSNQIQIMFARNLSFVVRYSFVNRKSSFGQRSLICWYMNDLECWSKNPGGLFSFGDKLRMEKVALRSMELLS